MENNNSNLEFNLQTDKIKALITQESEALYIKSDEDNETILDPNLLTKPCSETNTNISRIGIAICGLFLFIAVVYTIVRFLVPKKINSKSSR